MGIYNCSDILGECILSIINQTFSDWEFIICDDGSTDDTYAVAQLYSDSDSRIKLFRNEYNIGLAGTLNVCLTHASGEYIARMDGDDRSKPERLRKEVEFLDGHPEYSIVSTAMECFDSRGPWGVVVPARELPQPIDLCRGTPFCHAPCMVRHEAITAVDGYNTKSYRVEDYDLWIRLYALGYRGKNIMESLYEVRDNEDAVGRRNLKNRIFEAYVIFGACRKLNLSWVNYRYIFRPILVWMLPSSIYNYLRRIKRAPIGKS